LEGFKTAEEGKAKIMKLNQSYFIQVILYKLFYTSYFIQVIWYKLYHTSYILLVVIHKLYYRRYIIYLYKWGPRTAKTAEIYFLIIFFFRLNVSESEREKRERDRLGRWGGLGKCICLSNKKISCTAGYNS